ncbi:MAG TPA: hypothetical protein VGK88_06060 [bacterium]|jgi:hypothetical protein
MRITLEKDGQIQVLDTDKDAERITTLKGQGWHEKAQAPAGEPVKEPAVKGEQEKVNR